MNRAGLDMVEADSLDQVKGLCVYQLVDEEYREAFESLTKEVFKGKPQSLEFKMIGLKGRPLWLYTKAVPFRNEKGEVILALAITIDITERKRAAAERERLIVELREALVKVKQLSGLLPICSYCKKIRDDKGYWEEVSSYITKHSEAIFSHGMCPECSEKSFKEWEEMKKQNPEF